MMITRKLFLSPRNCRSGVINWYAVIMLGRLALTVCDGPGNRLRLAYDLGYLGLGRGSKEV